MTISSAALHAPKGFKEQVLLETGIADGFATLPSAVGDLHVAFNPYGISAVAPTSDEFNLMFEDRFHRPVVEVKGLPAAIGPSVEKALRTGKPSGVPIDWRGQTEFQRAVLEATRTIPPGEVRPYGWVARQIGRPAAVRAVGSALGQNPVPVLVACHRVIRSDGSLGQYRFGPTMKQSLLEAEGLDAVIPPGSLVGDESTRIVCYPSCRVARKTSEHLRKWFHSGRQATVAGYRPCEKCQPVLQSTE